MTAGKVYLIGAGPGSADLVTMRGLLAIRQSQVVIIDSLLPASFLADLDIEHKSKTVISLADGQCRKSQAEVNRLMADAADAGKVVARLKSGDPFVFGRGIEEAEFLTSRGIRWELVPGVTAATAGPASAAMAMTRRHDGRSFAVVTARCAGGAVNESFPRADSLAIFMSVGVMDQVVSRLMHDEWLGDTPAAVIERACQPWQRQVSGQLRRIAHLAGEAGIAAPAVLLVGQVARRPKAFDGRATVLFTGLDPTNFRSLGDVLHWPALRIVRDEDGYAVLGEVLARLGRGDFDHVIFTSRVGVRSFAAALRSRQKDVRLLGRAVITAAGAGTAMLLSEHSLRADVVPSNPGSEGILRCLGQRPGREILLVQGSHAPQGLQRKIEHSGGNVTRLALHRVEPNPQLGRPLPEHDVAYFVSPSGVRAWRDAYGPDGFKKRIWCIGEVTRTQLAAVGVEAKVVRPYG